MPRTQFRFRDDSESWPESLGVSVPIPSPLLIKFPCVHNDSKAIPKLFIYKLESRFRFRFRDYLSWNFGSNSDSGTTWAEISVPIPRRFRFLTRESRCFGSETREPGISGMVHTLVHTRFIISSWFLPEDFPIFKEIQLLQPCLQGAVHDFIVLTCFCLTKKR